MKFISQRNLSTFAIILALCPRGVTLAEERTWTNLSGGAFETAGNWLDDLVAGADDKAIFSQGAGFETEFTVTFDGNVSNTALEINAGEVTFDLGGNTYILTGSDGNGFTIKNLAQLNLSNGILENTNALLGGQSGWTSTVTVGTGAEWNSSGTLRLSAANAAGVLQIEDGGLVSSGTGYIGTTFQGAGVVTVTGTRSQWTNSGTIYVGSAISAQSDLTVENGGQVTTGSIFASLASLAGDGVIATKGVVLDGTNLVFDDGHGTEQDIAFGTGGAIQLHVDGSGALGAGFRGTGSLTIADGVTVSSSQGLLGYESGSTGTAMISGSGSQWSVAGTLTVGNEGVGDLSIENGAVVTSNAGIVGGQSGGHGDVTISGVDSQWTITGSLNMGYFNSSSNSLTIESGGMLSNVNSGFEVADILVTGAGSTWNNTGDLQLTDSTLTVSGGALVAVDGTLSFVISSLGSYIQLDGGYLAWSGDRTSGIGSPYSLISGGLIRVWDGDGWITASGVMLSYDYFETDEAALAFSGYEGLGGYTILTTSGITAVPEPSTYAAILGVVALGFVAWRRRRGLA